MRPGITTRAVALKQNVVRDCKRSDDGSEYCLLSSPTIADEMLFDQAVIFRNGEFTSFRFQILQDSLVPLAGKLVEAYGAPCKGTSPLPSNAAEGDVPDVLVQWCFREGDLLLHPRAFAAPNRSEIEFDDGYVPPPQPTRTPYKPSTL